MERLRQNEATLRAIFEMLRDAPDVAAMPSGTFEMLAEAAMQVRICREALTYPDTDLCCVATARLKHLLSAGDSDSHRREARAWVDVLMDLELSARDTALTSS